VGTKRIEFQRDFQYIQSSCWFHCKQGSRLLGKLEEVRLGQGLQLGVELEDQLGVELVEVGLGVELEVELGEELEEEEVGDNSRFGWLGHQVLGGQSRHRFHFDRNIDHYHSSY
jgi:hypothetical protein